ncbi:phage major capsid protein [Acinetobacter radioresistens]|uniref:phage major capsid protein n=1 Tax=Acinetobacter radioresistens TaxID=40216 RepID=UPI0032123F6C
MKALSPTAIALAMTAAQNQLAQPLSNLQTRDTSQLDQLAKQLRNRVGQFDELLERYKSKLEALDGLPDDLKTDLEARAKKIDELSGEIEEIQQKIIEGVHDRSRAEQDTIAAALIRNKDAVEFAKTMATRSGSKKESVVFDGLNARNVITLAGMGANASLAKNDLSRTAYQAPLSVIDLINWGSAEGDVAIFLRESAFEIMADIAPENTDKKESNLKFGPVQLSIGTIAHWIRASKQVLADMTWLANYIETRMTYGVRLKLEYFVVNGHTATADNPKCFSGLLEPKNYVTVEPEDGATAIDVLNQSKYKAADSYLLPDSIVLNPEDWGKIERIKGTDGHYIFGAPGAAVQPVLWGVPVVFAASMPKGKYWVGNLAIGFDGQIREDVAVTVSTEDGNNVTKNLVTILAEMRAAGAVVLPDACVAGDLPEIPAVSAPAP